MIKKHGKTLLLRSSLCPPLVKWAKWAHPIEKSWELLVWNPSGESWETCDYVCARHHCGDKEWGKFPPG